MRTAVELIEVLGPGCARCEATYRVVREVVDEARLDCPIRKSESVERMVDLGVVRTPAVAFDGRVVLSGRVPTPEQVRQLLGLA